MHIEPCFHDISYVFTHWIMGVSVVDCGIGSAIKKVIVCTWEKYEGGMQGGSPWYMPRSKGSWNITGPISMNVEISSFSPRRVRILSKFIVGRGL
jgi:hypothetical protein